MEKVLIAGATGYIGRYVVKEFKKRGYYVRVLVRNAKKLEIEGKSLEPAINKFIDDIFVGEITKPETLTKIMEDIDIVFSSVGKTRQRDKLTFMDVDYKGNKNLLDLALYQGVKKFIYVAILDDKRFVHLDVVKAKEKFVKELKNSGLNYIILRPNGFFSDMADFFNMAKKGVVFLIGNGEKKINPIHGEDLAEFCLDNIDKSRTELKIGGKHIYSYNDISRLAFSVAGKKDLIIHIPRSFVRPIIPAMKLLNRNLGWELEFLYTVLSNDIITNRYGKHNLKDFFTKLNRKTIH